MASLPDPAPTQRSVDQEEHRGGSEYAKTHQRAGRKMGKDKTAGYGQTGKQELHQYQGQVDQRL